MQCITILVSQSVFIHSSRFPLSVKLGPFPLCSLPGESHVLLHEVAFNSTYSDMAFLPDVNLIFLTSSHFCLAIPHLHQMYHEDHISFTKLCSFSIFHICSMLLNEQYHPELLLIQIWGIRIISNLSSRLYCLPLSFPIIIKVLLVHPSDTLPGSLFSSVDIITLDLTLLLLYIWSLILTSQVFWPLISALLFTACHSDAQKHWLIFIAWAINLKLSDLLWYARSLFPILRNRIIKPSLCQVTLPNVSIWVKYTFPSHWYWTWPCDLLWLRD